MVFPTWNPYGNTRVESIWYFGHGEHMDPTWYYTIWYNTIWGPCGPHVHIPYGIHMVFTMQIPHGITPYGTHAVPAAKIPYGFHV